VQVEVVLEHAAQFAIQASQLFVTEFGQKPVGQVDAQVEFA
jgi:hypothetical protein